MNDVVLVGLITGVSAIVASVVAQMLGSRAARDTEQKRLDKEEEREEAARTERKAERFNESKRAAFVRYLQLREEYRRVCHRIYVEKVTERLPRLNDRARYAGNDMVAIVEEIGLIDPDVHTAISNRQQEGVRDVAKRGYSALQAWFNQDVEDIEEIRAAMRKALAIN